jgi:hypothetical protein
MEPVKLLSMTAVLTLLVWAAADSLVNEAVTVDMTLEVVPSAANSPMLIEVDPTFGSSELEISGPRRIVEKAQSQAPLKARLRIPDRPTGPHTIELDRAVLKRELADQYSEFRKLTVVSVHPSTVAIAVDRRISKEVAITLSRLGLAYEVEPQLRRTSTTVHMRESRDRELSPGGEPLVFDISADVDRLFREQPAGESVTIPVTLDARRFGPDSTLEPDEVRVTATVEAQRSTAAIPTVPILLAVSFANLEKPYRPVTRDGAPLELEARTITVTGRSEEVAKLVRGDTRAYGIIRLKEVDLEELGVVKLTTPEYHLPPGVELAEPPQPVEFKLIDATPNEGRG